MIRVTELERMDLSFREVDGKALPERPSSQESYGDLSRPHEDDIDEAFSRNTSPQQHNQQEFLEEDPRTLAPDQVPPRHQSLLPAFGDDLQYASPSPEFQGQHGRIHSQSSWHTSQNGNSEANRALESGHTYSTRYSELLPDTDVSDVNESTSWLDTIDESGASSPSSVSKTSSAYLRHRPSRGTEADFDAALDAAVEAAYDEGLEPAINIGDGGNDIATNARRNVELAKQKVREAEKEAEVAMTRGREVRRIQEQAMLDGSNGFEPDYLDEESEEEERLLEEMTRGYVMDDFGFDLQSKSALPRQSDSSSFSARTWESSAASNTTAAGAALSTLAEDDVLSPTETEAPANTQPPLPTASASRSSSGTGATPGTSVRDRRLSGQNPKGLKIETRTHLRDGSDASASQLSTSLLTSRPLPPPKDESQKSLPVDTNKGLDPNSALRSGIQSGDRDASIGSLSEDVSTNTSLSQTLTQEDYDGTNTGLSAIPSPARPIGKMPSAPDNLGNQNPSLKTFRGRNVSVPAPDLSADSPSTPSSNAFLSLDPQKAAGAVPILPTPTGANFTLNGLPNDGLYLFDSHIHSPNRPGFPNTMAANHPVPLEPCPESFLLRPFWLMRCIYQTIAHPSGGYLSTKLFVPRDAWRVKNAKIKAVEEKVSNCDLLTAALLKLSQVDTYDADAVLEEMQSLESVLDQVQTSFSKKLGSEVGVHGAMPLFKMFPTSDDAATVDTLPSKASNGTGSKSYLTSWRKLRSKNSGFGSATPLPSSKDTSKDNLTINSVPMTPTPNTQSAKRDVTQLQFNGPNANYMGALARLCDAAQVIGRYLSPHAIQVAGL